MGLKPDLLELSIKRLEWYARAHADDHAIAKIATLRANRALGRATGNWKLFTDAWDDLQCHFAGYDKAGAA